MKTCALLVLLVGSAVGPHASAADTQSHLSDEQPSKSSSIISEISNMLSMRGVSMNVIEQSPLDDASDHRTISSFNIEGEQILANSTITDQIVDMIAAQLRDAGATAEDLNQFIANQTSLREFGGEQYPDDADDVTTEDPDTTEDTERDETDAADDEVGKSQTEDSEGSARSPKLLRATSPPGDGPGAHSQPSSGPGASPQPGGGPDVFNNGTDYFAWLEDIMKRVEDRMAKSGNTADETAMNEKPDESSATPGAQGFDDWKKSEDAHGGFDNIPKAVPMIVMSGNTYIKDIGNFRNLYQYGSLPMKVRTIEPNGNDSGLDLDDSRADDGQKKQGTAHFESRTRDGNTRARDRLLTRTAQDSQVHGHDDGNTYHSQVHGHDDGDSRGDSKSRGQGGDDSSTYHSDVHGHDDGDSSGDSSSRGQGGDDSSTYHSDVHGHDDGDSSGDNSNRNRRPILKASWGNVHGHDDGDSSGGSSSRGQGGDDSSTYNSDVHGHDDGDSRGDNSNRNRRPILKASGGNVHGHDDGATYNSPVHGHDDGSSSGNNSPVHGHDDGATYNSPVHGHDDGSSSGNNSPVHGHDDGATYNSPVHGHDDGSSSGNNSPVHGHDDGATYNSPVHGHDDGSSSGNNSLVHGHDDGGLMRAAASQRASEGRSTSMTMMNVSLTVLGTALVVLALAAVVTANRMRLGAFRRQDYITV